MTKEIHMSKKFRPMDTKQKAVLEQVVGATLPNGLEIGEICIPAGTMAWQLDDEYRTVLRYSTKIRPEDKVQCEALAERNPRFVDLLYKYL